MFSEKFYRAGRNCNELCKSLKMRFSITTCHVERDAWRVEEQEKILF